MSGRAELVAAARRSLVERGWGATTVRDIAATAGVSHAAIGYHFGSRDALMTEALIAAVAELADEVDGTSGSAEHWQALIATFETHRELWLAQLEAVRHAQRSPEVSSALVDGQRQAQDGLGGALQQALLIGLAVQHLVDPASTPPVADVLAAVERLPGGDRLG